MEGLMSFAEIGERIGTSEQEARQIYQGAVKKLRAYLRQHPSVADELWWFLEKPSLVPSGAVLPVAPKQLPLWTAEYYLQYLTDEFDIPCGVEILDSPENGQEAA